MLATLAAQAVDRWTLFLVVCVNQASHEYSSFQQSFHLFLWVFTFHLRSWSSSPFSPVTACQTWTRHQSMPLRSSDTISVEFTERHLWRHWILLSLWLYCVKYCLEGLKRGSYYSRYMSSSFGDLCLVRFQTFGHIINSLWSSFD